MKKIYQFELNKKGIFVIITSINRIGCYTNYARTSFKIFCINNSVYLKKDNTMNLILDRLMSNSYEDERFLEHFADIVLEHNLNNVSSIVCFLATIFYKNTKLDSLKKIYRYLAINGN